MSLPLNDADRDLWLSKFIDGELSPEQLIAVAEKVEHDSTWRADFEDMKSADACAAKVIERYHHDSPFSREVVRRLDHSAKRGKRHTKRTRLTRRHAPVSMLRRTGGWLLKLSGAAAFVAAAFYGWKYYGPELLAPPLNPAPVVAVKRAPVTTLTLSNELAFTALPDGTQVWMRKGSTLESTSARSVKFEGEAYFHVAPSDTPFTITSPDGVRTQALGTRFDVKTSANGERVRVSEGHVRVQSGATTVDALGGIEVFPDLHTATFDPRTTVAEWSKFSALTNAPALADGMISPWAQRGGSPSHSGLTPLYGPAAIVTRESFFATPDSDAKIVQSAAVITCGAAPRAYVIVRNRWDSSHPESEKQSALLSFELSGPQRGAWSTRAMFAGFSDCAPVVTPRGLVIFASADGALKAFNPQDEKIAWSQSLSTEVFALAVAADETVVCSTQSGLVAFNGRDGSQLWRSNAIANVKAPACILPNGNIVAVAEGGVAVQIDAKGHAVRTKQWGEKLCEAPVATEAADAVWLSSADGSVAKFSTRDGALTEKRFGKTGAATVLGNGALAFNGQLLDFTQPAPAADAPAKSDAAMALLQDGHHETFIAYKTGVMHQRSGKDPEFVHVTHGEVLAGGLSLTPGMLIVTTTQGIQIFE